MADQPPRTGPPWDPAPPDRPPGPRPDDAPASGRAADQSPPGTSSPYYSRLSAGRPRDPLTRPRGAPGGRPVRPPGGAGAAPPGGPRGGPPIRPYGGPPAALPSGLPAAAEFDGRPAGGRRLAALLLTGLVLGGLATGAWVFVRDAGEDPAGGTDSTDSGPAAGEARSVADQFAALLQRAEDDGEAAVTPDAMRPLVCDADMPEIEQAFAELPTADPPAPSGVYLYTVASVTTEADAGRVTFQRRDRSSGATETQDATLVREAGSWQVCGLSDTTAPTG